MKKVLLFIFSFLLFLVLPLPLFAQQIKQTVLLKNQTINRDYLVANNNVRISGTINGDAYAAGGNITVDGTVNGDLIASGGNILITGVVKNDVRVAGGNVTFSHAIIGGNITTLGGQILVDSSSQISGSMVGAGGEINILAPIGKGATLGGGQVNIANTINGDVTAGVGQLSFGNDSKVNGNVAYWSNNRAILSEGATISGSIKQYLPPQQNNKNAQKTAAVIGSLFVIKLTDIIVLLIMGLLVVALLPIYTKTSTDIVESHFWMGFLIGLIGIIITPIVILFIMFTIIGIPLGLFIFVAYLFILWFARIFPIIALGNFVLSKSGKKKNNGWALLLGVVIYIILELIPFVSFFAEAFVVVAGFGTYLISTKTYYNSLRTKKII